MMSAATTASYRTLKVRFEDAVCFIDFDRRESNNAIDGELIAECHTVLSLCEESASVVVIGGSREVFCVGADFKALARETGLPSQPDTATPLYGLWLKLATGPYVSIAHVRGKANAGGVGFVAACDLAIADETAQFSLSELLFGLYPACVLPFLIRRIGFQKAHYLTLSTQTISAKQANEWGLVDVVAAQSDEHLRRQLLRLRRLSKSAVGRYKRYVDLIGEPLANLAARAVAGNVEVFSDPTNRRAIARYVESGIFPWET